MFSAKLEIVNEYSRALHLALINLLNLLFFFARLHSCCCRACRQRLPRGRAGPPQWWRSHLLAKFVLLRFQSQSNHFPGGVALVGGNAAVVGSQPQHRRSRRTRSNRNHVIEFQRLIDGGQRVKAIGARRANVQAKIDLCVRTDGGGHTGLL